MEKTSKIYIAGHRGMVGSAILRELQNQGYKNFVLKTHKELDLTRQNEVEDFFKIEKPDYVFLAAAKVGGINANSKYQAQFLYENLMIQNNVIWESFKNNVKKLCFLGSSCIYPRDCHQPMKEEYFLTGPYEPTNEGYAIAKTAGYKLCYYLSKQYGFKTISLMPCNLYGKGDDFNLETSHVFSALIKRFIDAIRNEDKEITLWGTGSAKREFLYADDLGRFAVECMKKWEDPEFINVGYGEEITIKDLAYKIAKATNFSGKINWDSSKPDGMPRKIMDNTKMLKLGLKPLVNIDNGIALMIEEYNNHLINNSKIE